MYKLIINGTPSEWTKETKSEIQKLVRVYNRQDHLAGRPKANYNIIKVIK